MWIALFFAYGAWAQTILYDEYPLRANAQGVIRISTRATGDGSLFESITQLGANTNYPQFLERLKSQAPRLFRNHVLLHQSQSLQSATTTDPRVILFDQGTMLTFAETRNESRRNVEVLGWDPAAGQFRAAEIQFADQSSAHGTVRKNPTECVACHGPALRPIWLPYDFWPGAYGSNISRTLAKGETQAFRRFMEEAPRRPRHSIYSHLDFSLVDASRPPTLQAQAVELLTELIAQLNAHAGTRWLAQPDVAPIVPALVGLWGNCIVRQYEPIDENSPKIWQARWNQFVPSAWRPDLATLTKIIERQRTRRLEHKQKMLSRYERSFSLATSTDFPYMPERLATEWAFTAFTELLTEQRLGEAAPQLGTSTFELAGSISAPLNGELLWASLLATLPGVGQRTWYSELFQPKLDYSGYVIDWIRADCDALAEASRERLAGLVPHNPSPEWQPARVAAPLGKCAQCHAVDTVRSGSPAIPFDDPAELSRWLRDPTRDLRRKIEERLKSRDSRQMPPGTPLDDAAALSLRAALDRLGASTN